jgi:cyclase
LLVSLDAHPDRTLGARTMDCTILAHQKAAQVFRNRPTIFKGQNAESGSDWETYDDAIGMRWSSPDITFTERISLHWGGPEVILEHHPGPTPGSIWVIIPEAKVVFVGDTVVLNQPPFFAYADLDNWTSNIALLLDNYIDFVIVSGRGGPVTLEDIYTQQEVLKQALEGLENLAKKGAVPEDTQSLLPALLPYYEGDPELSERYAQRLRNGLYQSFVRRYRPSSAVGHSEMESEEL